MIDAEETCKRKRSFNDPCSGSFPLHALRGHAVNRLVCGSQGVDVKHTRGMKLEQDPDPEKAGSSPLFHWKPRLTQNNDIFHSYAARHLRLGLPRLLRALLTLGNPCRPGSQGGWL
ncbi:unnamed protein product [Arctogadus glacialis]